jgi:hypothetical protein
MPEQPLDELIRKYLEGVAAPAELADLEGRLADPVAADSFAQAARLDTMLRLVLREEGQVRETTARLRNVEAKARRGLRRRFWGAVAAAAAILIIGLVFGWSGRPHEHAERTKFSRNDVAAVSKPMASTPRSKTVTPNDQTPVLAAMAIVGLASANAAK